MEGIREIAKSYYQKASENEKNSIQDFFKKLDINGDGKISTEEIKKAITSWLSTEDVFKELDVDGNETLDFNEVLCLYYMEKKMNNVRCSGCFDLLVGPYFSCMLCLGKGPDTYDLCCSCYRGGSSSSHEHSSDNLLDHHSLIRLLRERTAAGEDSQRKREMEELREIAKAHYQAASPQVQGLAYQFYQSMDTDRDGWVNLSEFLTFMRQEGYSHMHNPYFFDELDRDGNGTLDFVEVMTLFYIIKSGRPFCGRCSKFIPGMFFSCVECFMNSQTSYHLCRDCYRSAKCNHTHNGRAQFLDNYTLLQVRRDPTLARPAPPATGFNSNNTWSSSSNAVVCVQRNYPNAIVPAYQYPLDVGHLDLQNRSAPNYPNANPASNNRNNWKIALNALEVALTIGSIAGTAAACTIM